MSTPRVTLVVPSFNHGRFVGIAVDSLLAQTYDALEVIVIDDGSTDDSRKVLQGYESQVHVVFQENAGQARTLNRGWALGRGEFVGYLSADDLLYPNAVERLVAALDAEPEAVVVYPDFDLVDSRGHVLRRVKAPQATPHDTLARLVCAPGPGALVRRNVLELVGGWDPAYRQMPDLEFWMRATTVGRLRHVPERLAAFRVHETSQSFSAVPAARADEALRAVDAFYAGHSGYPLGWSRRARAAARMKSGLFHFRSGRPGVGLRRLGQSITARPALLVTADFWRTIGAIAVSRPLLRLVSLLRRIGARGGRKAADTAENEP